MEEKESSESTFVRHTCTEGKLIGILDRKAVIIVLRASLFNKPMFDVRSKIFPVRTVSVGTNVSSLLHHHGHSSAGIASPERDQEQSRKI